jgi:putative ABC transport system permease protein
MSIRLALGGVAAGITIALMLSPLVASQLYGIGAADPLTIGGVAVVLLGVALIAAAVPARRVMRADPASTLRCD